MDTMLQIAALCLIGTVTVIVLAANVLCVSSSHTDNNTDSYTALARRGTNTALVRNSTEGNEITSIHPVFSSTLSDTNRNAEASLRPCQYTVTDVPSETLYSIGDKPVDGSDLKYFVGLQTRNATAGCLFYRDDIEPSLKNASQSGSVRVVNVWFQCQQTGMRLLYTDRLLPPSTGPLDQQTKDNVSHEQQDAAYYSLITYVKVIGCQLDLNVLAVVSNMTDLRIAIFFNEQSTSSFAQLQTIPDLCHLFRNVVGIGTVSDSSAYKNIHYLSNCGGFLEEVVEVVLRNSSLDSFPVALQIAMPNMRALIMDENKLTSPVEFPWRSGYALLPRNLSRSHLFNVLYSYQNAFDIAPNLFRRVYTLDNNRILNLTCFGLHGEFQYVSFQGNKMKWISDCGILKEVKDLQFLSIANNHLQSIPENLFSKLFQLRRLDLQQNLLESLPIDIFKDLQNLEKLNLAGNKIVSLQAGLFGKLLKLTDLTVSNNTIQTMSDVAISRFAGDLKTLDLSNNSISAFPVIALLLPGIATVNLDLTDIEILDFADIDSRTTEFMLARSAVNPSGGRPPELENLPVPTTTRMVTLRNSRLRGVAYHDSSSEAHDTFIFVMKFYTFIIDGSPLACDSNILNATHLMRESIASGILGARKASLQLWRCAWPPELKGRPIMEIMDEETYLPLPKDTTEGNVCPGPCSCYRRAKVYTVIVDCRDLGLEKFPDSVPLGTRELWLQNNSIQTLPSEVPYLRLLTDLRLSSNQLQEFPESFLNHLESLHTLYLEDNLLGRLSPQLGRLHNLSDVRLAGNTFRCDCRVLWMKSWLLAHQAVVKDVSDIKCSTENGGKDGQTLVAVQDDHFVCPRHATLGQLAVPVAVPVGLVVLLGVLLGLSLWHRRQLKILLYIYTGLHPFDRDPSSGEAKAATRYDVVVCCSVTLISLVLDMIVRPLEQEGLGVFFYSRDALLGESTLDNVRRCVMLSRRLLVVISKDWTKGHLLSTAVREGLSKSQEEVMTYLVLVLHELSASDVIQDTEDTTDSTSKDLSRMFIKSRRCLNTQDKHFLKRLLYEMPVSKPLHKPAQESLTKKRQDVCLLDAKVFKETAANIASLQYYDKSPRGDSISLSLPYTTQCAETDICSTVASSQVDSFDVITQPGATSLNDHNYRANSAEDFTWDGLALETQESVTCTPKDSFTHGVLVPQSVFVWYCDQDLQFTLARLAQPLEQRGHRCVLQDRDFALGAAIQDNILQAVQTCARSVFVLSRQTADSEWFLFAFHVAFERGLNRSRDHRLLLLRRQGVEAEWFAEEVRQVLQNSTVLDESDPWFVSRLNQFVEDECNYCLT